MSYNNLCRKMENVLHGYLGPLMTDGVTLYKTMDGPGVENLPDDRVEVACPSSRPYSTELDASSGLTQRYVTCHVTVRTRSDVLRDGDTQIGDARDRHDQHVGVVMDALYVDGLADELNAIGIAQISVEQIDFPTEETSAERESGYMTLMAFDVLAHSIA
jgi:hypothetical protein